MKQIKLLLFIIACTNIFAACKKTKTIEPEDQLPPATQTGANTFGCLINGKVYVPKGYTGTGTPNPQVQYDINLNGRPYLGIIARKIENSTNKGEVLVSYRNLDHLGNYTMPNEFDFSVGWSEVLGNCTTIAFDTTTRQYGGGVITRLDIPNHIISGTFSCKFKTITCDTVYITDGRFDIKF